MTSLIFANFGFFYSGSNRHLDLDGILFLGGVRTTMYSNLPGQIISKHGYQVTARKCSLLCFGYVREFLMLIWEMAFVFHKSKQAQTRVTLNDFKEIVKRR